MKMGSFAYVTKSTQIPIRVRILSFVAVWKTSTWLTPIYFAFPYLPRDNS